MFETFIDAIHTSPPLLVFGILLAITFIENIFPPSPSDVIVVMGGALIARGTIDLPLALIFSSLGSEAGFLLLYYLGTQTDKKLIRTGKLKFITQENLESAERWFTKYGYGIILVNRFMSGIRSVIAFFAGVSELQFTKVVVYSTISSVVWNLMLLLLGIFFGSNIQLIDKYLGIYSTFIFIIISAGLIIAALVIYIKKRKKQGE